MSAHLFLSTVHLASLLHYPPPHGARLAVFLFVVLLRVTATETASRTIPRDAIWLPCLAAVLRLPPWPAVLLAAAAGVLVPLVARAATRGGLGIGDLRLCWALHLCAGPVAGLAGVLAASLIALAVTILRRAARPARTSEAGIAFGPYLVAGVIGAVLVKAG